MLIESKGITHDTYYIPPFTISNGEIIVLHLFNGPHFYELSMRLAGIFSGRTAHEQVIIHQSLTFVAHFIEPAFRRLFFPVTIKEYIRKRTRGSITPGAVSDYFDIKGAVSTLDGGDRKILSLITTLYNTPYIMLDLIGVDPLSGQEVYKIVKRAVENGGAAILMENSDEFKYDCTRFIPVQVLPQDNP